MSASPAGWSAAVRSRHAPIVSPSNGTFAGPWTYESAIVSGHYKLTAFQRFGLGSAEGGEAGRERRASAGFAVWLPIAQRVQTPSGLRDQYWRQHEVRCRPL